MTAFTTPAALDEPRRSIWSRPTVSWMLYDLANTVFSFMIITLYFPRWVVDNGGNDAIYGNVISLSMLLMFVTAPVLGALSDMARRRMPFLVTSTLLCIVSTALMGQGGLWPSLFFFAVANYFFQAGLIFYDALLPVVSTEENRGRVSGIGVGVGYIGSFLGLGVGSALLAGGAPMERVFQAIALIFLVFAIPCFLLVRERPRLDAQPLTLDAVKDAFGSVAGTLRRVKDYPGLGRFLLGRVFYTDVANTLIPFMGIYVTEELNFTEGQFTTLVGISIAAAVIGGLIWGVVVDRLGPKRTLDIVLFSWMGTLLLAVAIPFMELPYSLFYLVGALAGINLGGTWASDRTLMLRLSPPRYLGQFYGLYAMVGRFGQIIGPFMWGFVAVTMGLGRAAALFSLFILIVIAWAILRAVSDQPRPWREDELIPQ